VYGKVTGRPSSVRVRHVDSDGDSAAVTVAFDVAGTKTTRTFTLHKDGHEDLVFDHWVLDAPHVPTVELDLGDVVATTTDDADTPAPATVLVNGQETVVDPDDPTLALLPGRWTVTLPDAGPYLEASTVTYLVTDDERAGSDDADRTLTYTVTDAALREAEKQAKAKLDGCLASTDPAPDGCPNDAWILDDDEARDGRWKVTATPTLTATPSGWARGEIEVESSDGEAVYGYTLPKNEDEGRSRAERETSYPTSLDDRTVYTVADGTVVPVDED